MTWVNPRTWIDGIRITKARLNEISSSLRETAPAKAQAPGDLFYATGRNSIARLAIGSVGRFLVPTSSGPRWQAVPTPITSEGDLVIGNSNGRPSRFPAGSGIRVLAAKDGSIEWKEEIFLEEWWGHSQWWTESSSRDMTLTDGDTLNQSHVIARNISISGDIEFGASPTVIRAKTITLGGDVTIRCVNRRDETNGDFSDTERPNAGGGVGDKERGSILCGGAGGVGGSQGADGDNATQSVTASVIAAIAQGVLSVTGGGSSRYATNSGASGNYARPAYGGGVVAIFASEIDLNSHSLAIDCSGEDGAGAGTIWSSPGTTSFFPTSVSTGGGGGGAILLTVQDGVPSITSDISGGDGGSNTQQGGGTATSAGGDGGVGTLYTANSIPS